MTNTELIAAMAAALDHIRDSKSTWRTAIDTALENLEQRCPGWREAARSSKVKRPDWRCETCGHWENVETYKVGDDSPVGTWGLCAIINEREWCCWSRTGKHTGGNPRGDNSAPVFLAPEGGGGVVIGTGPSFGCALWEPRP